MQFLKPLLTLLFFPLTVLSQDPVTWMSSDGRSLTATFVKLSGDAVTLTARGQEYKIPLSSLSPESIEQAKTQSANMLEWAAEKAELPILSEEDFHKVFDLVGIEGKIYLVEGIVTRILTSGGLRKNPTYSIKLTRGLTTKLDFVGQIDNKRYILKHESNRILKMKATESFPYGGYIPYRTLIEVGQKVAIKATIQDGAILTRGLAESHEVAEAKRLVAEASRLD